MGRPRCTATDGCSSVGDSEESGRSVRCLPLVHRGRVCDTFICFHPRVDCFDCPALTWTNVRSSTGHNTGSPIEALQWPHGMQLHNFTYFGPHVTAPCQCTATACFPILQSIVCDDCRSSKTRGNGKKKQSVDQFGSEQGAVFVVKPTSFHNIFLWCAR